jgi:SET domain-containing protein
VGSTGIIRFAPDWAGRHRHGNQHMSDKGTDTKDKEKKAGKKKTASDRIEVRQSGVHGKGVYAIGQIAEGERVIEYKGEHISWKEALKRHPHDPNDPNHTFYFSLTTAT